MLEQCEESECQAALHEFSKESQCLLNEFKEILSESQKALKYIYRSKELLDDIEKTNRQTKDIMQKMDKHLLNEGQYLKKSNELLGYVDETLTNVLLAIRQNEYMQAYYPAQHGEPAKKVVGKWEKS